ncbi:unnamed protein product [Penicillium viridicatum]
MDSSTNFFVGHQEHRYSSDDDDDNDGEEADVRKNMNASEQGGAIDGILHEQQNMKTPTDDRILAWIEGQYRAYRGFEMGTFQTSLLCTIMNKQSGKWTEFALMHTLSKVLLFICPEEQIMN